MNTLYPNSVRKLPCGLAVLAVAVSLAGCATRPTAAVLQPASIDAHVGQKVAILAVTNRKAEAKDNGYTSERAENLSYETYGFSVPSGRKGVSIAYPQKTLDARRQFVVTERDRLTRQEFVARAARSVDDAGTVAVFVHGYNYSYQEALYRTAQMAADAAGLAAPILFSWPSAASVAGYVADRDASLASRSELDALLKTLAAAPGIRRIVVFGHSMGGFLTMEAVRQLRLQGNDRVVDKLQVVLAAPDIDVDVFKSQLSDIGRMPTPITLLVSPNDRALRVSSVVGGERKRVGQADINDPFVQEVARRQHLRVIDITSAESYDGLGHDRFASLARFGGDIAKAEQRQRNSAGNIGAFVFDAAGAAVASPFRLVGELARQ